VEVGTHLQWVQTLLQELGHEVIVANARQVRLIYRDKRKNDRLDAEKLARLVCSAPFTTATSRARANVASAALARVEALATQPVLNPHRRRNLPVMPRNAHSEGRRRRQRRRFGRGSAGERPFSALGKARSSR
jgi:transposase